MVYVGHWAYFSLPLSVKLTVLQPTKALHPVDIWLVCILSHQQSAAIRLCACWNAWPQVAKAELLILLLFATSSQWNCWQSSGELSLEVFKLSWKHQIFCGFFTFDINMLCHQIPSSQLFYKILVFFFFKYTYNHS